MQGEKPFISDCLMKSRSSEKVFVMSPIFIFLDLSSSSIRKVSSGIAENVSRRQSFLFERIKSVFSGEPIPNLPRTIPSPWATVSFPVLLSFSVVCHKGLEHVKNHGLNHSGTSKF